MGEMVEMVELHVRIRAKQEEVFRFVSFDGGETWEGKRCPFWPFGCDDDVQFICQKRIIPYEKKMFLKEIYSNDK